MHVPDVLCAKLLLTNKANQALTNAPRIMIMVTTSREVLKSIRANWRAQERVLYTEGVFVVWSVAEAIRPNHLPQLESYDCTCTRYDRYSVSWTV